MSYDIQLRDGVIRTISDAKAKTVQQFLKSTQQYLDLDGAIIRKDQITFLRPSQTSDLPHSEVLMKNLYRGPLEESRLREGWFRALCIAVSHGMSKDSPLIKRYAEKYGVDIDVLYPQKCPVCPR